VPVCARSFETSPKALYKSVELNCAPLAPHIPPLDRNCLRLAMRCSRHSGAFHEPERIFQPTCGGRCSGHRTRRCAAPTSPPQPQWSAIGAPTCLAELNWHTAGRVRTVQRFAAYATSMDGNSGSCRCRHFRCQRRAHPACLSEVSVNGMRKGFQPVLRRADSQLQAPKTGDDRHRLRLES